MVRYVNLRIWMWESGLRRDRLAQALQMDEALLSRILHRDETWLFVRDPNSIAAPVAQEPEGHASAEAVAPVAAGDTSRDEATGSIDRTQA